MAVSIQANTHRRTVVIAEQADEQALVEVHGLYFFGRKTHA